MQQVHDYVAAKQKNDDVIKATDLHRNTIVKMRKSLRYCGVAYPPTTMKVGRRAALRQAYIDALSESLRTNPQAYIDEIVQYLDEDHGVAVSRFMVYRALVKLLWSRKVASKAAKERSEPLHRVFSARVNHLYKAEQIVAIDETACNERTGDRKYGWSPIGSPMELVYSMKRSERWKILPAITVGGYLAFTMIQGAVTAEIFETFLQDCVLSYCIPGYLVLVMDNASIHRSQRVKDLCADFGVQLEYLPPYSPDYNPIEKSFKVLKSWIKRNWRDAEYFDDYSYFLFYAIKQACCGDDVDARSWFVMCGYSLDSQ